MWASIGKLLLKLGTWAVSHPDEAVAIVKGIKEAKK